MSAPAGALVVHGEARVLRTDDGQLGQWPSRAALVAVVPREAGSSFPELVPAERTVPGGPAALVISALVVLLAGLVVGWSWLTGRWPAPTVASAGGDEMGGLGTGPGSGSLLGGFGR